MVGVRVGRWEGVVFGELCVDTNEDLRYDEGGGERGRWGRLGQHLLEGSLHCWRCHGGAGCRLGERVDGGVS